VEEGRRFLRLIRVSFSVQLRRKKKSWGIEEGKSLDRYGESAKKVRQIKVVGLSSRGGLFLPLGKEQKRGMEKRTWLVEEGRRRVV